jgi:RNA polymerase sigma-70 factor (ECF subfamily)
LTLPNVITRVEAKAHAVKVLRLQPGSADQHSAEGVYRVLLQNLDALYATARRLTGRADLAEDLVQETARKALEAIPALKDDRNMRAWLFRILLNGIRDYLRRKKVWEEVEADERLADPDMVSEGIAIVTAEDVRRALASLAPAARAMAILADIEDFTIAEAATILQISPGTAASRLWRAHRKLRGLLKSYQEGSSGRGGRS